MRYLDLAPTIPGLVLCRLSFGVCILLLAQGTQKSYHFPDFSIPISLDIFYKTSPALTVLEAVSLLYDQQHGRRRYDRRLPSCSFQG